MNDSLIIAFNATEAQKERLVEFCNDRIGLERNRSVAIIGVNISDDYNLFLSLLENHPEVYIGILSRKNKAIMTDAEIEDDILEFALDNLDYKYAMFNTKKSPEIDPIFATPWLNYMNSDVEKIKIPLHNELNHTQDDPEL